MSGEVIRFKIGRRVWTGRVIRRRRFWVTVEHNFDRYNPYAREWISMTEVHRVWNRNIISIEERNRR